MERKPKPRSGKDITVFEQTEGNDKGKKVEIITEDDNELILKNVGNGFRYRISRRSFNLGYKRVNRCL